MPDEAARLLYDILQYTRAQAIAAARPTAKPLLDSAKKCAVYAAMDGKRSQKEIVDATKIPQATVSTWMGSFFKAGIAVPGGEYYSGPRALFTLDELGVQPPAEADAKKTPKTPAGGA